MTDLLELLDADASPAPRRARPEIWRVAICAPSSVELWRGYSDFIERLVQEGFEVHVLAADDGALPALRERGVFVKALPGLDGNAWNPGALIAAAILVQAHLIEHPCALVHGIGAPLAWIAALAARRVDDGGTVIAQIQDHSLLTEQPVGPGRAAAMPRLSTFIYELARETFDDSIAAAWGWLGRRVDAYVTTTREDLDLLLKEELVAPSRIEVLLGGQGYDKERFSEDALALQAKAELRAVLGVPRSWERVIGVSAAREDGVVELPALLELAAPRLDDVGWLVSTPRSEVSRATRESLAPWERRGVLRYITPGLEPESFYASCDLFVAPRYAERISTSMLEAQAMGVPVVTYATRAARAIIDDGEAGVLAPIGDIDALGAALVELIGAPEQRERMARHCASYVRERFGRQASHEQLLRLYDRVIQRSLGER